MYADLARQRITGKNDQIVYAHGTKVPIAHAFEKEGLYYRDIQQWFDRIDAPLAKTKLQARLDAEKLGRKRLLFTRWLNDYSAKYRLPGSGMVPSRWEQMNAQERFDFIFKRENPFEVINGMGREQLFLGKLLSFNWIKEGENTPSHLKVGADLSSYEVRSATGEANRTTYQKNRAEIESGLKGQVGHQHLVHAWPDDAGVRAAMAPKYIELLDSTTWYLFWRQLKRDPDAVRSILPHKYLGVYTRSSLNLLYNAVLDNEPKRFNNKFRMLGARRVSPLEHIPGQQGYEKLPDLEMRSGNKGIKREFIEDMLEARLASGDYSGLLDFKSYDFDASSALENLTKGLVPAKNLAQLKLFEGQYKLMHFSLSPNANNHFRNKVIAPLLPWEHRLPLGYKLEQLKQAQKEYALGLSRIAGNYLKEVQQVSNRTGQIELNKKTGEQIEALAFEFSDKIRLDKDFERYLTPMPAKLPTVTVKNSGPIDVNQVDLGIEYSFRFPEAPRGKKIAAKRLEGAANALSEALNGSEPIDSSGVGHGHNLSHKYTFTDAEGQEWRIEWDGIGRSYRNGKPILARGGHAEVPSPKFAPQDANVIQTLYQAMRTQGMYPKRSAGGAHLNEDLSVLMQLPPKVGARKMADTILTFESNQEMTRFLWQSPTRVRSALPVELSPKLIQELNNFGGDWNALGKLLYEEHYFNPYETRKPAYVQLNATAVMAGSIPPEFDQSIDIKNPEVKWFPAFGGKGKDRIEFRLYDAPSDEYIAGLQIKYARALMNLALNAEEPVKFQNKYSQIDFDKWKSDPSAFIYAAEKHLRELGLDPKEFRPLLVQAPYVQSYEPKPKPGLEKFNDFLTE